MTTLQVLTVNWTHIFNFIVLALSFAGFIISYNKYMKRTVDISDLDKLEKKMDKADEALSKRVDKLEERHIELIQKITDSNTALLNKIDENHKETLNHIINCTKR